MMEKPDTVAAFVVRGAKKTVPAVQDKSFNVLLAEAAQEGGKEYRLAVSLNTPDVDVTVGCNIKSLLKFLSRCRTNRWDT